MLEKLSDRVGGLEESKSEWEALAREILSTITLEGNKEVFASLPEDWHRMVSAWVDRFHVIEAAEQSVYTDAPKPFVNHCKPVNGVHAPFCNGDHSARG